MVMLMGLIKRRKVLFMNVDHPEMNDVEVISCIFGSKEIESQVS